MRRFVVAIYCLAALLVGGASSQDGRTYAALAANNEGNLQVRWGRSKEEAKQRASEACWRVSRTCSSDPAHTDQLDDVFAYVCCSAPHFSCVNAPHETRQMALNEAFGMMSSRGYASCQVRGYISARTGQWEAF